MTKSEIKRILKEHGYTMIKESWYRGKKSEQSALFIAYDKYGVCHYFYVNWGGTEATRKPFAIRQTMSHLCIHESRDVTRMFFKERKA